MLTVDGTHHSQLLLHEAYIVHKVCTVEDIGVHAALGVPHIEGNEAGTDDLHLLAVEVLVLAVAAATGHGFQSFIVSTVKFFFHDGCFVAGKYHLLQISALIEGLVTHTANGVRQSDQLQIAAGQGHCSDTDRTLCDLGVVVFSACPGDQLQAVINRTVQAAVNNLHRFADIIGVHGFGVGITVKDHRIFGAEGCDLAQCEGVVAQAQQVFTQLHLCICQLLLHKCHVADGVRTAQVQIGNSRIGKGIAVYQFYAGQILDRLQVLTVRECALTDGLCASAFFGLFLSNFLSSFLGCFLDDFFGSFLSCFLSGFLGCFLSGFLGCFLSGFLDHFLNEGIFQKHAIDGLQGDLFQCVAVNECILTHLLAGRQINAL